MLPQANKSKEKAHRRGAPFLVQDFCLPAVEVAIAAATSTAAAATTAAIAATATAASTTVTTTATAASATWTAASAAEAARLPRTGLIDGDRPAAQGAAVGFRDSLVGCRVVRHFHESEAPGLSRVAIANDGCFLYCAVCLKGRSKLVFADVEIQIAYVNVLHGSSNR
jgi:hypothetical protein